jgi:hypothetical protein
MRERVDRGKEYGTFCDCDCNKSRKSTACIGKVKQKDRISCRGKRCKHFAKRVNVVNTVTEVINPGGGRVNT